MLCCEPFKSQIQVNRIVGVEIWNSVIKWILFILQVFQLWKFEVVIVPYKIQINSEQKELPMKKIYQFTYDQTFVITLNSFLRYYIDLTLINFDKLFCWFLNIFLIFFIKYFLGWAEADPLYVALSRLRDNPERHNR